MEEYMDVQEPRDEEDVKQFLAEAMAGEYDELLMTCMRWVNVE